MTTTTSISVSMSSDNDGQTAPSLPVAIGASMISRGSELVGSSETISKTEDTNHKDQSNPVTETQTVVGTELDDSSLTLMSPFGCGGKHSNMQIQENSCLLSDNSSVSSSEMFGSDKIPSNNVNLDILCDAFADCSVQSQDMFGSGYNMIQPTDSSIAFSVKRDISSSSKSFDDRAQSPPDKNTDVDVKHAEVCNTRPSNPANIGAPSHATQALAPVYPPMGWLPPGAYYHPVQYHAQSGFPEWNSPRGAPFNANQFYPITPQHMAQYPAQVPTEYFYTYPVPVDPHRQSYPATSVSSQYMTKAGRVDRPPVPLPRDIRPHTQESTLPPSQSADHMVLRMSVKSPTRSADGNTTNTTMSNSQQSSSQYSDKNYINRLAAPRVQSTIEEDEMTRSALNMDRLGYLKDDSHTPDKGEESSVGQLDRPAAVAGSGDTDTRALSETCIDTNKVHDSWVKHVQLRKIGPQWVLFFCGMPVKIPPKLATVNSTKLVVDCTGKLFIANEIDVYEVKKTHNRIIFNNLDYYEENKSDTRDIYSEHGSLQFNSENQLNKDSSVELELAGKEHELKPHFSTDSVTSVKDGLLSDNKHHAQIPAQISNGGTSNYVNMQPISESSMQLQQDETISISQHTDSSSTAMMSDKCMNKSTSVVGETLSDKRPEFALAVEKIAISGSEKPEVLEGQKTEVTEVNKDQIGQSKLKNGIEVTFKDHKNGIRKESVKKEESFPGLNSNTEATSHAGENVCRYEATEGALIETGDVTQGKHKIKNESDIAVKRKKLLGEKDGWPEATSTDTGGASAVSKVGTSGNSLPVPGDIGAADMNGSRDKTTIDRYVVVDNIEPGITDAQLKTDLLTSDFPIRPPTFVYPGGAQALLICDSKEDAAEVTGHFAKKVKQRFAIRKLKPDVREYFRTTLDPNIATAAKQKGILDDLVKELEVIHVSVPKEINADKTELITNTSLQIQKCTQIIEKFAANKLQLTGKSQKTISDCVDIDSATCSSTAWDVCKVVKKSLLGIIKKENISVSYIDGKILIDRTGPQSIPDNVRVLVSELKEFLSNEFEEIPIDGSGQDAGRWCSEIEKFVGIECCIYAPDQNTVIAYSDEYDRIQLVKHQLNIKQGKVRQTGRGRHQRALVASDNQLRALANPKSTLPLGERDDRQHTELEPHNSASNWKYDADNVETYHTAEGITIKVYVANILKLHVDCIVNAANRSLQHGGGVARVIADAAGYQLTQECNTYVRTNGDVPVGMAYVSTAGKLPYRCVIHTVGPCWSDYRPHSLKDVQNCEDDLYNAILYSFFMAEKEGLKSIALPAVSSAILFRVPQEICAYQYAKATMDYSKKSVNAGNPLQEIHFIDKDEGIVNKIQQSFTDMFRYHKLDCPYNIQSYVGQKQRWHSPVRHPALQSTLYPATDYMLTNMYHTGTDSTQSHSKKDKNKEPFSYEDKSTGGYTFHMIGDAKQELRLYVADILRMRVSAIACSDDSHGSGKGFIARKLAESGKRCPYETDKKNKFSKGKKNGGDVVVTAWYGNYKKIFHAILPSDVTDLASATVKPILKKAYSNILQECVDEKLSSIAMSLLATGRGDKLMTSVQAFQESYTTFCKKMRDKPDRLTVHLVCHEQDKFLAVNKALYTYVKENSKKSSFPPPRPPLPLPSPSAEGKFQPLAPPTGYSPATGYSATYQQTINYPPPSPSSHTVGTDKESPGKTRTDYDITDDNCVICMDPITDPKSLKCGHKFCRECIDESFKHKKVCPMCGAVCGIITGDQPPGTIQVYLAQHQHCTGYESVGQLQITYNFPSGHQGAEHPTPGRRYRGISRTGYLPDNKKGRLICKMLQISFERRLVFTIGESRTTGQKGVITWNDICHKTDPTPHTQFGYPDPSYLDRVIDELSAKGVTEADVPESSHM